MDRLIDDIASASTSSVTTPVRDVQDCQFGNAIL